MKRTIAIMLAVLILSLSLIGCSDAKSGYVSDSTDGTIRDRSESSTVKPGKGEASSRTENALDDIMDSAGNALEDTGAAIKDATPGAESKSGTGMTGSR